MEIIAFTLPVAYHLAISEMNDHGEYISSEAWGTHCKELRNVHIVVLSPLAEPRISKIGIHTPESLDKYVKELCDGTFDWAYYCGKEAYTYHERFAGQLKKAIDILRADPTSRRAVITVRRETDIDVDDQPCLTSIQFAIRNGLLNMTVYFRSNDLMKAFFMNAYALIELQRRVADELGVLVGRYDHYVFSLHVYQRDLAMLRAAAKRIDDDEVLAVSTEEWREAGE